MIDLTSDKIRKDVINQYFFNQEDIFFNKLGITRGEYSCPLGLHIYLRELRDGYYYAKSLSEFKICNEIVGRYLCDRIGLETTSLDLLIDDGEIKIVTPNYKDSTFKYQYQKDDVNMLFTHKYNVSGLAELPKAYQKEQFKLIAIDMMMEQWDRHAHNMEEVIVNDSVHLTPVIDFENSFDFNSFYNYYNPYINLPKNIINISKFLNDFPDAYKYILEVFDIDSQELVRYIENIYPIKVLDEVKNKYDRTTSRNQKMLKLIK